MSGPNRTLGYCCRAWRFMSHHGDAVRLRRAEGLARQNSCVARYLHAVRYRHSPDGYRELVCREITRSSTAVRNIQRRAGRAGFAADSPRRASRTAKSGDREDIAIRTVADLVDNNVTAAGWRGVGYGDMVGHRATVF